MKDKDGASAIIVTGLFEIQQWPHLPFHCQMWCGMNKSYFFQKKNPFGKAPDDALSPCLVTARSCVTPL